MPDAATEVPETKPRKLSVLQMANNFAQRAEEATASSVPAAPEKPTIKWLTTDKVLRLEGNTVTKKCASSPAPGQEYGVAVADVSLSSGVHGMLASM